MKQCFVCKESLSLDCFYKHPATADGRLNKCKECAKAYARGRNTLDSVKEYEKTAKRMERARERNRNRPNAHERSRKNCERERKRYASDPEYRALKAKKLREYRAKNKDRNAARALINRMKREGKLKPPSSCIKCPTTTDLQAHHEDYSKPLDVMWLCTDCHGKRHKELNEIKRNKK